MRWTINLATRTYLDHRKVNLAIGGSIALLVCLLAWGVTRFAWNVGELRRLKSDLAVMEGKLGSRPAGVSESDYRRLLASIRFYNGIIVRKSVSWTGLLDRLEGVVPEGIALTSLVPDPKSGEVKIEGRARSFVQVRTLLEHLEGSNQFTNVLLLSHRDIAAGERGRGVQFTISCRTVIQ